MSEFLIDSDNQNNVENRLNATTGKFGLTGAACNPREYGSDVLAFVGDGVFGLMVREYLAISSRCRAGEQHNRAVAMVRCEAQAEYMERIIPHLTEEEEGVFRRGRNYHTSHTPRKSTAVWRRCSATCICQGKTSVCANCLHTVWIDDGAKLKQYKIKT